LTHHDDCADPDIPLQIWWALEAQVESGQEEVLKLFADARFWHIETVRLHLLERLMQRFALEDNRQGYAACTQLIGYAPSVEHVKLLFNGLQEGLRGRDLIDLPRELVVALEPYRRNLSQESLAIGLRQGNREAIEKALGILADAASPVGERLAYIRIFGEIDEPQAIPKLLAIVENNRSSPAIRQAALLALQRYDREEIGQRIVKVYPDKLRADPGVRRAALNLFATRVKWANDLLTAIDRKKKPGENFIAHTISKDDVPEQVVRQLQLLKNPSVSAWTARIWPEVRPSSPVETNNRFVSISQALKKGSGDVGQGKSIFSNSCGPCHRLFNQGGTLGPDLTGYDRKNIDELLTSILDPAAYVREGYSTYRISTVDGRVLMGMLTSRSGTSVTLALLSGETITLPESEINDMQAQPSMMPDNLLDKLTDQEIRDLFTYLTSNQ
jgi:putative heme-binding domain-containing protein